MLQRFFFLFKNQQQEYLSRKKLSVTMTTVKIGNEDTVKKVADMRIDYTKSSIDESSLPSKDPFEVFRVWFEEACQHPAIEEGNAMNLATASKDGVPSARIVLLKGFSTAGFRFFTNYASEKGQQLAENPHAALTFYWEPLQKQVRISGRVERLSDELSTEYFNSRPISSQIGAHVSHQTSVIPNRKFLEDRKEEIEKEFDGMKTIPKPEFWGGFLVKPSKMEFWCGGSGRLHSRVRFRHLENNETLNPELTKQGAGDWFYELLSP